MQMDGAALYAAAYEAHLLLEGGHIERIAQPNRFDIVFTVRAKGTNHRLLFSADPECARMQLGGVSDKGPEKPFVFLMMLRKHLLHGRILTIAVPTMDRVIHMDVQVTDDLGDRVNLCLMAECMGKHSNLILVDPNGLILDSAKRIPPAVSSVRTVLPGERYHVPPVQQKHNALMLSPQQIAAILNDVPGGSADNALVSCFYGISLFTAQQLCMRAGLSSAQAPFDEPESNPLAGSLFALMQSLYNGTFESSLQRGEDGAPLAFAPFTMHGKNVYRMPAFCDAVLEYFSFRHIRQVLQREQHTLKAAVDARLLRLYKRLQLQQDAMAKSASYEQLREQGEFMLAYAHQIKRGTEKAEVYDYIHQQQVELKLDPLLSATENAAKLFKRYQKLKATAVAAQKQKADILPEISYWEGILLSIEQSEDLESLLEIRRELTDQHLLCSASPSAKCAKQSASRPLRFVSHDGVEIFAGRNNAQNDLVTCRLGRSNDTFMHAQGMPGSHILIKANPVPSDTLWQAAQIAAFFSRGRHSANVPIDYALIKNVRKPSGAKPGFVTYTGQKTLFVTPDPELVKSLIREQ